MLRLLGRYWFWLVCGATLLLLQSTTVLAQNRDSLVISKGTTIYLTQSNRDRKRDRYDIGTLNASYIPSGDVMIRKGDKSIISWKGKNWVFVTTTTGLFGYIEENKSKSYWDEETILKWHHDNHITQMISVHFHTEAHIIWPDQCRAKRIELRPRRAYRAIDSSADEFPGVLIVENDDSVECDSFIPNQVIAIAPTDSYSVYFMPQMVAFSAQGGRVNSHVITETISALNERSRLRLKTADILGGCNNEVLEFTDDERKQLIASIRAQLGYLEISGEYQIELITRMVRTLTFNPAEEYSASFFAILEPAGIERIITRGPCGGIKDFYYGSSDSVVNTQKISFEDFSEFDHDQQIIVRCTEDFIKAQNVLHDIYHFDRYETAFLLTHIARIYDADKGTRLPSKCP